MRITGDATVDAPVEKVWDALLDPAVLVRTIPGCERLETTGEHTYSMTVTAGVAAIKGTYSGTCSLQDLRPHESLLLKAQGSGAPGTIGAEVQVGFTDNGDGTTTLTYDADAVVGGMIGGVGQRMLTSVSKRMAAEFFGNVGRELSGTAAVPAGEGGVPATAGATGATGSGAVFSRPAAAGSGQDFRRGLLVGAGLVLAGVVAGVGAGVVAGRRR